MQLHLFQKLPRSFSQTRTRLQLVHSLPSFELEPSRKKREICVKIAGVAAQKTSPKDRMRLSDSQNLPTINLLILITDLLLKDVTLHQNNLQLRQRLRIIQI